MSQQIIDSSLVERAILDTAPERADRLHQILEDYRPQFAVVPDSLGFVLKTKGNLISFNDKTMKTLWILAHAAWRIFECHSPHVLLSIRRGRSIAELMEIDKRIETALASFEELLYIVQSAAKAGLASELEWPDYVPSPSADRSTIPVKHRATFDLAIMATAYVFLHEIQHVIFNKDRNAPAGGPALELACDAFARDFLLAEVRSYAKKAPRLPISLKRLTLAIVARILLARPVWSKKVDLILMKRAMAVSLGAFFVYEITATAVRAGNQDYPPFADRFETLIGKVDAKENSDFWVFAATLLFAELRRLNPRQSVRGKTYREICIAAIDAIREATPEIVIANR